MADRDETEAAENPKMDHTHYICPLGKARPGAPEDEPMPVGGTCKYLGPHYVIPYNAMAGDNRRTENTKNHTVNHTTGDHVPTENADTTSADGWSKPGNGAEAVAPNEMGGCEAFTYDCSLVY